MVALGGKDADQLRTLRGGRPPAARHRSVGCRLFGRRRDTRAPQASRGLSGPKERPDLAFDRHGDDGRALGAQRVRKRRLYVFPRPRLDRRAPEALGG